MIVLRKKPDVWGFVYVVICVNLILIAIVNSTLPMYYSICKWVIPFPVTAILFSIFFIKKEKRNV